MKRLSEITESIWSDMQERGTGDTIKKEDQIITNIKDMKPVDLGSDVPVYFADIDLEVNGEVKFTWEEVKGFIQKIEETGWELPAGPKGMQSIFYNGNQPPRFRDDAYEKKWVPFVGGTLTSNENDAKLFFPSDNYYLEVYWCVDDNYKKGDLDTYSLKFGASKRNTQRSFIVGDPNDFNGCLIRTNNEMVERKCRIRLIRYK